MPNTAGDPLPIRSERLLAVEGKDEINLFNALLDHMDITGFDIREVGGKDKFSVRLPALKNTRGFDKVTHIAIVRDKNSGNAFKSICDILTKGGLSTPTKHGEFSSGDPEVGIFIMPGNTIQGTMLEDLCLETVKCHPAMKCVDEFALCVSKLKTPPRSFPKAKVQAFLAAQPDAVDHIGLGAEKRYWDFNSPCLEELKTFLNRLK